MENETRNGLDSSDVPERNDEQGEYKGKNLEEAISLAEHRLKTPRDKLNYEIVTEKTRLFGIKSKEIVIRAWPRQEEGERRVEGFLKELLKYFPLEISYEVKRRSDFIFVVFDGPDKAMLLRSDGALLLSLQHILNKISSLKVQVDCEFFKRRKERKLKEYAQGVARQVAETGREEILEPMNPYERRVVHIAVNQVPGITSESIGDGFLKKVKIFQTEKG